MSKLSWSLPLLTLAWLACPQTPTTTDDNANLLKKVDDEEEENNNIEVPDASTTSEIGDPPECPALSDKEAFRVPRSDGGMAFLSPEIRLPATCGTRASSVTSECGSPAEATLTIGDDSYELKWACNGRDARNLCHGQCGCEPAGHYRF